MAFPASSHADQQAAINDLLNRLTDAGYTAIDSDLGEKGVVISALANMLDQFPAGDGTVSAPSISNAGDSNTGIFFSAADTVDVAAGGVRALQLVTATTGVNYLKVTPAAAGADPALAAAGADTDIDVQLSGKGVGGIIIGGGTALTGVRKVASTLTPSAIAANTAIEQTFTTFSGLTTADTVCFVEKPTAQGGLGIVGVRVVAADNVGITFANVTGSAITPTAGQIYKVVAFRS